MLFANLSYNKRPRELENTQRKFFCSTVEMFREVTGAGMFSTWPMIKRNRHVFYAKNIHIIFNHEEGWSLELSARFESHESPVLSTKDSNEMYRIFECCGINRKLIICAGVQNTAEQKDAVAHSCRNCFRVSRNEMPLKAFVVA